MGGVARCEDHPCRRHGGGIHVRRQKRPRVTDSLSSPAEFGHDFWVNANKKGPGNNNNRFAKSGEDLRAFQDFRARNYACSKRFRSTVRKRQCADGEGGGGSGESVLKGQRKWREGWNLLGEGRDV